MFGRRVVLLALLTLWPCVVPLPAGAAVYPPGVEMKGAFGISSAGNLQGCCWVYGRARFGVWVPGRQRLLVLTVFIPDYAIVNGRPQSFSVKIQGSGTVSRCCYGSGLYRLAFAVKPEPTARMVSVQFVPAYTFVPAAVGAGGDTRHLSVLLQSAVVGVSAAEPPGIDRPGIAYRTGAALALVLAFAGVLVLSLRAPVYAVAALIATDPFALYLDLGPTTATLPKAVLLAAVIGVIIRTVRRPRIGHIGKITTAALALLVLSMLVSFAAAGDRGAALRETLKAVQYLATFAAAYVLYRAQPLERVFRNTLTALAILVSLLALLQLVIGAPESTTFLGRTIPRIGGPIEGPNQLAGFLGVVLPMVVAWMLHGWRKPFAWCALIGGSVTLLLTFSRGGIAAFGLAAALMIALVCWPAQARAAATAVVGLWATVFALACAQFSGAINWPWLFGQTLGEMGLGTRTELWHAAYALWRSSPWIGIGPANFELQVWRYDPGVSTHANSVYFNTLAEQGLAGAAALAVLLYVLVASFARRFREPLALGALGVIVAMAFHQIVDTIWIYPKVGVIFWAVLGISAAGVDVREDEARGLAL